MIDQKVDHDTMRQVCVALLCGASSQPTVCESFKERAKETRRHIYISVAKVKAQEDVWNIVHVHDSTSL